MKCNVCQSTTEKLFTARVLNKYEVSYYLCGSCGFIQTEKPYWLPEAYSEALNVFDTGAVTRCTIMSRVSAILITSSKLKTDGMYLDYAGGYGLYTRMMRDLGFQFLWQDQYAKNLFSRGFEVPQQQGFQIEMVTAFEVFEHFENPISEVEKLLQYSDTILFSTRLVPSELPTTASQWEYFAPHHGQHISFWTQKSLKYIADKYQLTLYTNNEDLHLLSRKSFSPLLVRMFLNKKVSFLLGGFLEFLYRRKSRTLSDQQLLKQNALTSSDIS